jgi:hypothetical protein
MFVLGRELGKSVAEIGRMSAREFAGWSVFLSLTNEELQPPPSVVKDLMNIFGGPRG